MKKVRRVTRNEEISEILSHKQSVRTPSFTLFFRPAKENHARIGISAGKKLGNAVVRNRVKRQVRALINEVFDFSETEDFVLIVKPAFMNKEYSDLKQELQKARTKAQHAAAKRGRK